MFSGAVTNKQSTLFLKSIFLTCLIFFKSVDPAFSGLRKKKGFAKFFLDLLTHIKSIRFTLIGLKTKFFILNKKFICFSVCNFGSKPRVIFVLLRNISLGNFLGIVIILKFFPD